MSTRLSCTILFIIAVCERATGDGCNKTQCLENNQFDNDCCGLNHAVGCNGDYLLSFTADNGCIWNRGTCCTKTPKLYTSNCSTSWCSSPNGYGGFDCWAGGNMEECTCLKGTARETGSKLYWANAYYYSYTCCTSGENIGNECGDIKEDKKKATIFWITVLSIAFGLVCLCVSVALFACYKMSCCCWQPSQSEAPQIPMAARPIYNENPAIITKAVPLNIVL